MLHVKLSPTKTSWVRGSEEAHGRSTYEEIAHRTRLVAGMHVRTQHKRVKYVLRIRRTKNSLKEADQK